MRPFDSAAAPVLWRGSPPPRPDWPTLPMTDEEIAAAYPRRLDAPVTVNYGPYRQPYPAGTIFYPSDFVTVRTIQQNLGRRPIAWSVTTGRSSSSWPIASPRALRRLSGWVSTTRRSLT